MESSTLLLAALAAYLYFGRNKLTKKITDISDTLSDVTTSFDAYKAEQQIKEEIDQTEKDIAAANADVSAKCFPIGFYGIIGNYFTSDKYISAEWYVKFRNVSNDDITVNFESCQVTILNSRQIGHQNDLSRKSFTVPAKSETQWMQIAHFNDDILYGYSTVGKDIQKTFPNHRYNYWYKAVATLKYTLSNPYVNAGLSVDVPAAEVDGGVYGVHIWDSGMIKNQIPALEQWADYYVAILDAKDKQWEDFFGNKTFAEVKELAKTDLDIKRKLRVTMMNSVSVPEPSVKYNRFWYNE